MILVGNPENRRVGMFQAALAAQGRPPARVIAWRDLIEPGAPARGFADVRDGEIVRIDSAGENDAVERALLRRGEIAARAAGCESISARELDALPYALGRIVCPRQAHLGFTAVLDELARALPATARVLQPPRAIALLFDKAATSAQWRALGIPVPDALPAVRSPDELREHMRARGWPSVFVKLTCGSSASCLAVFTHGPRGEHVLTTVEDAGAWRYNTRKLQRLVRRASIDRTLGFILGEGAQVERAHDKAMIDGRHVDLRVLAIDGVAAFVVARTALQPITNLHLGGLRGDVDALRARVPPAAWDALLASAIRVQQASGAFHVGVDVMLEADLRGHRVIEGNAFGDLLPNLERDGLDVYGWQVARLGANRSLPI